jgi:hypothetical protein
MTAKITGKRGDQYLVDFGDGTGAIYDADEDWLYPPRGVATLAAQGEPCTATLSLPVSELPDWRLSV